MILNAIGEKLKHQSRDDFRGRHFEIDHFRVKKNIPKIGGFQSFNTARRTIAGFEAKL